jgi:hypothetical protein
MWAAPVDMTLFIVSVCAIAVIAALLLGRTQFRRAAPKSAEQERAEHLDHQFEAVSGQGVTFYRRKVMNRGEYELFRAALSVTGQPQPTGSFPFYVFPQVSLGQIIGTETQQAYRAINSKRCDLLVADRQGNPVAVLEYQGSGHNIGGTAQRRDEIKRMALEQAGVRFVEIRNGATQAEIQKILRDLLTKQPIS